MITAALLAALGLSGALVAFAFWQARRAASSADGQLEAVKHMGDLDLALAARGRAVEDRDTAIANLKNDAVALNRAISTLTQQRDQLVANMSPKDSHAAVEAIRGALGAAPSHVSTSADSSGVPVPIPALVDPFTTPNR